jgi:hypothetical protein
MAEDEGERDAVLLQQTLKAGRSFRIGAFGGPAAALGSVSSVAILPQRLKT